MDEGLFTHWRWDWFLGLSLVFFVASAFFGAARLRLLARGNRYQRVSYLIAGGPVACVLLTVLAVTLVRPRLWTMTDGWILLFVSSLVTLTAGVITLGVTRLLPPLSAPEPVTAGPRPLRHHYRRWIPVAVVLYTVVCVNLWTEDSRYLAVAALLGGPAVGTQLFLLDRRHRNQEATAELPRGHVLLLRTFARDYLPHDENALARQIRRQIGDLVALGDPREPLPSLGARKVYLPHDAWQEHLTELARRARAIVMWPDATPSVRWELAMIRREGLSGKLFVLVPPPSRITLANLGTPRLITYLSGLRPSPWTDFATALRENGFQHPATPLPPGSVLAFDPDGRCTELARGCPSVPRLVGAIHTEMARNPLSQAATDGRCPATAPGCDAGDPCCPRRCPDCPAPPRTPAG